MFEQKFKFQLLEDEFTLALRADKGWSAGKERVLIILQTVPQQSLEARDILPKGLIQTTINNALNLAIKEANKFGYDGKPKFAIVNFNAKRHLHLKGPARLEAEIEFGKRVQKIIKKLNPTHVFVSGDEAARQLIPIDNHAWKRGWVHEVDDRKFVSSFDFDRLLEKNGKLANLLGFWFKHLAYLLVGKHPFSIKDLYPKPVYVGSIKRFDRMMDALAKTKRIAVDSETKNLSVLHNKLYTIQFATETDPEVGYVLPVDHPQTPFTKDEIKYIKRKLKAFFSQEDSKQELVTFNGMYDLRIIRRMLRIPIIWHDVWEITAGEHLIDENINIAKQFQVKQGNLMATLCRYENGFYLDADFSKEDRNTTGSIKPDDPGFLKYAAMDVVSLLGIHDQQIKQAETMTIQGKPYKPYYLRHVRYLMGPSAHQLSHLSEDGSMVDRKFLRYLMSAESPLRTEIQNAADDMRKSKAVIEANAAILKAKGVKTGSLFANRSQWTFSPTKPDHLRTLFFDVKGLKPVSQTATGKDGVGKEFIAEYKKDPEVLMYSEWQKRTKLLGTYVKKWLKILTTQEDAITDDSLRPGYSFFGVLTGRLNSEKPSLQQIPARDAIAKLIKRLFIAPKGKLLIRFDYSAHEVRMWSVVSNDLVIANAFRQGQKLRQQWIQTPTKEVKDQLATKGDIHIQNVYRFFKKWVDKSDPLRSAVKAVVFGVLYGKSAKSLGEDVGKDEDYAQNLIDTMFAEFKMGAKWTNLMKKMAEKSYYVFAPTGRRRNLWAAMTEDRQIVSRQVRRGSNAPIQGFASEVGTKASRLIMESYYKELPKLLKRFKIKASMWDYKIDFNRIVHDASYFAVPYDMVIPFIHFAQYEATYGIANRMEKEFGIKFTVEPEIEMEFGARDDRTIAWNWSLPNLIEALDNAVKDAHELGQLEGAPAEVLAKILRPYNDKKTRDYLQKHYPLLGVPNLNDQIDNAVSDYSANLKRKVIDAKKSEADDAKAIYDAAKKDYLRFKQLLAEMEEIECV